MKVLFYMATPGGLTGAPRRLLTLTSILKRWQIKACIASEPGSELLECAEIEHTETVAVKTVGILGLRQGALFGRGVLFRIRVTFDLLRQNLLLYQCIRRNDSDAVWLRGSKGIAFGAVGAVLSRRPLAWDVDYELPSRGIVRWLHLLGLKASRVVIFQHHAAAKDIFGKSWTSRYSEKFRVIVPGIDLASLKSFRERRKRRKSTEEDAFVILQVGTICDRKNQRLLIEAVSDMVGRHPTRRVKVWLAGGVFDEAYCSQLQVEVRKRRLVEVVTFLGWRKDVHELMTAADLLAMPSRDEGVPNTVQEAMAIGLPVLVSDAGGMPEVVKDGQTGWVLSLDTPAAWGRRLHWCMNNRRQCEEMGERGHEYAWKYFGAESWGSEYSRVLRELA